VSEGIVSSRVIAQREPVELVEQRDDHTRVWEIAREVETTHPDGTKTVDTVKSYIHEKGSGLCYWDASGNLVPSVAEWRETPEGFVIDRCGYWLSIGKTIGSGLRYMVDGHELLLRAAYLMVSDGANEGHLAVLNPNATGFIVPGSPSVVRFPAAFGPGYDLEYLAEKDGFHQNLILANPVQLPKEFDAEVSQVYLYTELDLSEYAGDPSCGVSIGSVHVGLSSSSLVTKPSPTDNITFTQAVQQRDGTKEDVRAWWFAESRVFDSSGLNRMEAARQLFRQHAGAASYLVESIPQAFLNKSAFPVVLDYRTKSGPIINDETWDPRYTYWITGDLNVSATLEVLAGTTVKVDPAKSIYILSPDGRILAEGQPYRFITFTKAKNSACGEQVPAQEGNACYLIYLQSGSSSSSVVRYCKMSYAFSAIDMHQDLVDPSGEPPIANNIIRDCGWAAYMSWSSAACQNNLMANCTYGVDIYVWYEANMQIRNNTIDHCSYGIKIHFLYSYLQPDGDIAENLITYCNYGVSCSSSIHPPLHHNAYFGNLYNFWGGVNPGTDNQFLNRDPYNDLSGPGCAYFIKQDVYDQYLWQKGSRGSESAHLDGEEFSMLVPCLVSGSYTSGNTTWQKMSPCPQDTGTVDIGYHHNRIDYYLTGDVKVTSNTTFPTLTILPGTAVVFGGDEAGYSRYLIAEKNGKLVSIGDPGNGGYNLFTRRKSVSMVVESPHYTQTAVGQVQLLGHKDSRADFCRFERGACLRVASLNNPVSSNRLALTYQGLYAYGSQPLKVLNNLFYWNAYGYYQNNSYVTVSNNTLDGNDYGCKLLLNSTGNPPYYSTLHDNLFTSRPDYNNPYQYGIHASTTGQPQVHENFNHFFGFQQGNECVIDGQSTLHETDVRLSTCPYGSQLTGYKAAWFLDNTRHGDPPKYLLSINGGSRSATDAGLQTFTTSAGADRDSSDVDIGYHYAQSWFPDSEPDGMPDAWEILHFGTTSAGPSGDPDVDNLNNLNEYTNGTDPNNANTDGDSFDGTPVNDGTEVDRRWDPCSLNLPRGPYLQSSIRDAGTSKITVSWRSAAPGCRGSVAYCDDTGNYAKVQEDTVKTEHEITITGLVPDTVYYYSVGGRGDQSQHVKEYATRRFRSAPSAALSAAFVVYGDNRAASGQVTFHGDHNAVVKAILAGTPDPPFVLHVGDFVLNGGNASGWNPQFFGPALALFERGALFGAPGNHEYYLEGNDFWKFNYTKYLNFPPNERWYKFDYAGCRIFSLDSWLSTEIHGEHQNTQRNWFAEQVAQAHQDKVSGAIQRIFVLYHVPAYSSGEHGNDLDVQVDFLSNMEKYGVDMVLAGHDHDYERQFKDGVYHFVTGGGGAQLRPKGADSGYSEVFKMLFHHCRVEVGHTVMQDESARQVEYNPLTLRAIDNQGALIDRTSIVVGNRDTWRYYETQANLGTAWRAYSYDDYGAGWQGGPAYLGFGEDYVVTHVTEQNKHATYYFRRKFYVEDPSAFQYLRLDVSCDDGCVMWLSKPTTPPGQEKEVFRTTNLPANPPYDLYAQSAREAFPWIDENSNKVAVCDIVPGDLAQGFNVLAVEAHIASVTDDDLVINLKLSGHSPVQP
jgi:hypothetical protein